MVDSLIEASKESLDLVLDRSLQSMFYDKTDVFLLVFFGDRNLGTPFFEINHLLCTKLFSLKREVQLKVSGGQIILLIFSTSHLNCSPQ